MNTDKAGAQPISQSDDWQSLPVLARGYVATIIVVGAAALALDLALARLDQPVVLVQLLTLAILTSVVKISVPLLRGVSSLSLSYAVTLAAIPILGGTDACLIGMASAWTQCTFRMKARNRLHRTLFSIAMVGLSVNLGLLMFDWARAEDARYILSTVRPILLATTAYFVANSVLLAAAIGLTTRQGVFAVWRDNFLWSAPAYFVAGVVAILAVIAADAGSRAWATALAIPLYLTYRSYRCFVVRIEVEEAQVRQLSDVHLATTEALALAIEVKDGTSPEQIRRMQRYAEGLARAAGMTELETAGVKTAALLHDIGNLAVPEHILVKPGALSQEEFEKITTHPRVGADIVQAVPFAYPVGSLILAHHEHWDGSGYPLGLRGDEIPLGARVLAVVDSFTALLAERPYRRARPPKEAAALLEAEAGSTLDPALVAQFLALVPSLDRDLGAHCTSSGADTTVSPALTAGSALDQIVRAHREVQVLQDIAEGLGASLNIDATLELLASTLPNLMPVSCAALFLWDAEVLRFHCRRAIGIEAEAVGQLSTASLEDLRARVPPEVLDGSLTLRSVLASALMSDGQIVGALVVYSTTRGAYGGDQRRLLDRVSRQAAPVICNAIIFEQTHEASLTDSVTGLANRRALHERLARDFARAQREHTTVSVVLIDLDGFKQINDSYGHDFGDRALRTAAEILRARQRPNDMCARYGGDEFVVVLWDCTAAQAETRRVDLQRAVASASVRKDEDTYVRLSVSAGAATSPGDGTTADALLALADQRMYIAKTPRGPLSTDGVSNSSDTLLRVAV